MEKAKVGMMALSLARERKDLAASFYRVVLEKLRTFDEIEVVEVERLCLNTPEATSAARGLENRNVDCILMVVGTWIKASMVVTAAQHVTRPLILWGMADEQAFSLVGAAISHGSLDEVGISHKYLYGKPDEEKMLKEIVQFARAAKIVNHLKGSTLGAFGGRSMGMYTAMVDQSQVKRIFGVEIKHIDQWRIILEAKEIPQVQVEKVYSCLLNNYGKLEPNKNVIERSIRVYLALKEIKKQENLDFLAVKCQPELIENYTSACLANTLLIDEGVISSCECDINAALTMQILQDLSGSAVLFADLNAIYREEKAVRLVNCGSAPTTLAKNRKSVNWALQYPNMGKGGGVTTVFWTKDGTVTLARLFRIKGEYVLQIAAGESIEQPRERLAEVREKWPQAYIKLYTQDIEKFIQTCRSNHMHMTYGNYVKELREIAQILGLKTEIA